MAIEMYHGNIKEVAVVGLVSFLILVAIYYMFVKPHTTIIERDAEGRINSIVTT